MSRQTRTPRHDGLVVGLDVGTSNVKALACTADGTVIDLVSAPLRSERPRRGWEEYRQDALDAAVDRALSGLTGRLQRPQAIRGIAVASMAETAFGLDRRGRALRPAIAWHDRRGAEDAEAFAERFGRDRLYQITGLPPRRIFGMYKLGWLRRNEPERMAGMVRWLNVADYVTFRLCGEQATDPSLATRTGLFDIARRAFSPEVAAALDIDLGLFAPIADNGTALATVSAEIAGRTGLSTDTVVSVGGHDHPCGALGVGLTEPGGVLDSLGTAESVLAVTNQPALHARLAGSGYEQGSHVVPGRFYAMGGVYTAGAAIEWATNILGIEGADRHDTLLAMAAEAPAGAGGAMFLPHLRVASPPHEDNRARAAFAGLTDATSRADLARAVLEGLAYEFVQSLQGLRRAIDLDLERLLVIGGGARNDLGIAIKQCLLDMPIGRATVAEATALGAAMLASVGAGIHADVCTAARTMASPASTVDGLEEDRVWHRSAYERYVRLYPALREWHYAISDATTA